MADEPAPRSRGTHAQRAEAAYELYRVVQARIERHEALAQRLHPGNDRMMARWLASDDNDHAWRYRMLCSQRSAYQTIIAVETAMASLYPH